MNTPTQHTQQLKGGPICKRAVLLCKNPAFRLWLDRRAKTRFGLQLEDGTYTEEDAKDFVLRWCEIPSRAQLDHNKRAAERYGYLVHRFRLWRDKQPP